MAASKTFEDLIVWQKAHAFVLRVYQLTARFPKEELFGLTSQLRRAAVSIPANVAEGFKKLGKADKLRFYNTSQESLEECRYYLMLARDLKYGETQDMIGQCDEVSRLLEAYMGSLRSKLFNSRFSPLYWLLATGYWLPS
jgi:four helix bundle protein